MQMHFCFSPLANAWRARDENVEDGVITGKGYSSVYELCDDVFFLSTYIHKLIESGHFLGLILQRCCRHQQQLIHLVCELIHLYFFGSEVVHLRAKKVKAYHLLNFTVPLKIANGCYML